MDWFVFVLLIIINLDFCIILSIFTTPTSQYHYTKNLHFLLNVLCLFSSLFLQIFFFFPFQIVACSSVCFRLSVCCLPCVCFDCEPCPDWLGCGWYADYSSPNYETNNSIRAKSKLGFLENLNAKLAEQRLSGKAFAVRNIINSKALVRISSIYSDSEKRFAFG